MIIKEMFYIPIKLKPERARASMTTSDVTSKTYLAILHLFSLFAFVSAADHYFRIWTGQVPALF
jgi:hypothetical protein